MGPFSVSSLKQMVKKSAVVHLQKLPNSGNPKLSQVPTCPASQTSQPPSPNRVSGGAIMRGITVAENAKAPAGNRAAMQPYFFCVFLGKIAKQKSQAMSQPKTGGTPGHQKMALFKHGLAIGAKDPCQQATKDHSWGCFSQMLRKHSFLSRKKKLIFQPFGSSLD